MNKKNIVWTLLLTGSHSMVNAAENLLPGAEDILLTGFTELTYESGDNLVEDSYRGKLNPVLLVNLSETLFFESEFEISFNDEGDIEKEVEYANIYYFLNDSWTIRAGQFLLPFGQFSLNIHPSWINRSPWTPGVYGSHDSSQSMTALLPVMSDKGFSVQKTYVFSQGSKLTFDAYVTYGARSEIDQHDEEAVIDDHDLEELEEDLHEEGEDEGDAIADSEDGHALDIPEIIFETRGGDNNNDRALGGRVAYAFLPGIEIGASFYKATYDDAKALDFKAKGLDINLLAKHFLLRGEYIDTEVEGWVEENELIEINNFKRDGWYLQGTWHLGQLGSVFDKTELVMERSKVSNFEVSDRWMYGLNYWFDGRSVVKMAYEETNLNDGRKDNRFAIQVSYGF